MGPNSMILSSFCDSPLHLGRQVDDDDDDGNNWGAPGLGKMVWVHRVYTSPGSLLGLTPIVKAVCVFA